MEEKGLNELTFAYSDEVDREREQMQLEFLFDARKDRNDWDTGDSLAAKALQILNEKEEQMRGLLDDNK
mgnify:CR=1 FL=1